MKNINDYKYKIYFNLNHDGDFYCKDRYDVDTLYTKTENKAVEILANRLISINETLIISEQRSYITSDVMKLLDRANKDIRFTTAHLEYFGMYECEISNGNYDIEMRIEKLVTELDDKHFIG